MNHSSLTSENAPKTSKLATRTQKGCRQILPVNHTARVPLPVDNAKVDRVRAPALNAGRHVDRFFEVDVRRALLSVLLCNRGVVTC